MNNKFFNIKSIFLLSTIFLLSNCLAQGQLYNEGMKALSNNDTVNAEKLFKESIIDDNDSESLYELSMIQLHRNTFYSRNQAYNNLYMITLREPKNLKYKYAFADLCKDFARLKAISEYKEILEIDSTQVRAWLELARQEAKEFDDYNHSIRLEDEFSLSLQEFANEDFADAERYFTKAVQLEPLNREALFQFALLYEKAGKYLQSITLLQKFIDNKITDREIHLAIGLLFYKTGRLKESYEEYKIALTLMTVEEREDFTFNSVKMLIEPVFEEIFQTQDENEQKEFVELYWKVFDPLYMTEYNERLLEHYSRVAFANLHFSVPRMGIEGWKSNRGETVIRFGEPFSKTRIRPSMGGFGVMMKTEVWNYPDMVFGFTDMALNNNFVFAAPAGEKDKVKPQFSGDSNTFAEYLRKARYYSYDPKFEGPKFDVPFTYTQFKNLEKRNHTDFYINFGLTIPDSIKAVNDSIKGFDLGFVLFDKNSFDKLIHVNKTITSLSPNTVKIDSVKTPLHIQVVKISTPADSGVAAFEIMRRADKGVFANRGNLTIRKFSNYNLDISDLLIASKIESGKSLSQSIIRGDYKILPSIQNKFRTGDSLYIYYEVYNLRKGSNGLTDFYQSISFILIDESNEFARAVSSVGKFLGLKGDNKITLSSKYQTEETDSKIYLQLDMSEFENGKYKIVIEVKDNISGTTVSTINELKWEKK